MDWQFSPWGIPGFAFFVAYTSIAIVVFGVRPRRFQNRILALALALDGLAWLSFGVLTGAQDAGDAWAGRVTVTAAHVLAFAAYLAFLGTLRTPLSRPLAGRTARAVILVGGMAVAALVVVRPGWFYAAPVPVIEWGWDAAAMPLKMALLGVLAAILLYGLLVALALYWVSPPGSQVRQQARVYAAAFGARDLLWGLSLVLVIGGPWAAHPAWLYWVAAVQFTGIGLFAVLLPYGFLKHQVLDIDLRIKWAIKKSTLVAIFVGVFFVSAQVAQAFLVTEWGWAIGGVVAGLLLLAINPLQRLAGRVADAAMPRVVDTEEYRGRRKEAVYRATLEAMLADGTVTVKERRVLVRLQEQLGMDAQTAQALELAVIQTRGVD